jgi:K+-sensing histidine kinase KdpD
MAQEKKHTKYDEAQKQKHTALIGTLSSMHMSQHLTLLGSSYHIAAHDFATYHSGIVGYVGLLKHYIEELILTLQEAAAIDKDIFDRIKRIQKLVEATDRITDSLSKQWHAFFNIHLNQNDRRNEMFLISSPWSVFSSVVDANPNISIKVRPRSARSLVIPFPGPILYGIMSEIVKNAIRHISHEVDINVHWHVCGEGFVLLISDNGKEIGQKLTDYFIPYDRFAEILQIDLRRNGGLGIISRLIALIDGSVFFRRSKALGGLMLRVQIPIPSYIIKNKIVKIGSDHVNDI